MSAERYNNPATVEQTPQPFQHGDKWYRQNDSGLCDRCPPPETKEQPVMAAEPASYETSEYQVSGEADTDQLDVVPKPVSVGQTEKKANPEVAKKKRHVWRKLGNGALVASLVAAYPVGSVATNVVVTNNTPLRDDITVSEAWDQTWDDFEALFTGDES